MGVMPDPRVAEKKAKASREEPSRDAQALADSERPQALSSFEEIYNSDEFTIEAAVKAFLNS